MRAFPLALLILCGAASADSEVLPTVTTELKRDSGVIAYRSINALLSAFKSHGQGLFRMNFKVDQVRTPMPLKDVRLVVRSDEADYPIAFDEEGRFELPVLTEAEAKTADIATNVPKGKLLVHGDIEPTTAPSDLDLRTVRQIVAVGGKLREEILPWYLRWIFPRVEGVRICSDKPAWQMIWDERGSALSLPLQPSNDRDPETKKGEQSRPCTLLTGQENWPETARLNAPRDTKLSVKFQGM